MINNLTENGVRDINNYRKYTSETLSSKLGIDEIKQSAPVIIDIENAEVISIKGVKYQGITYHRLKDLPDNINKIDKNNITKKVPTFTANPKVTVDELKIELTNISINSQYTKKYKVEYKISEDGENEDSQNNASWITAGENLTNTEYSFNVQEPGTYKVKIVDAQGEKSEVANVEVKEFKSEIGTTIDFGYTGNVQEAKIPCSGYYQIECWGASNTLEDGAQAKGEYAKGIIYIEKDQMLYGYVGQAKSQGTTNEWNAEATDIRLIRNDNWDDFDSLKSRIIVASGGNGQGYFNDRGSYISGHQEGNSISEDSTQDNISYLENSSHYTGAAFTNTEIIDGNGKMPDASSGEMTTGNTGNGHIKITYYGDNNSTEISLNASNEDKKIKINSKSTNTILKTIIITNPKEEREKIYSLDDKPEIVTYYTPTMLGTYIISSVDIFGNKSEDLNVDVVDANVTQKFLYNGTAIDEKIGNLIVIDNSENLEYGQKDKYWQIPYSSNTNKVEAFSQNKINVTDLKGLEINISAICDYNQIVSNDIYVGLVNEQNNAVEYIKYELLNTKDSDKKSITLDVSELTGEFYLKISIQSNGDNPLNANLEGRIYSILENY